MLKEFYRIMRASGYKPAFWWGIGFGTFLFGIAAYLFLPSSMLVSYLPFTQIEFPQEMLFIRQNLALFWLPVLLVLPLILLLREILLWPKHEQPFAQIAVTILGIFYISIPMALLNVIAFAEHEGYKPGRVFCLILFIWAADTGAYFAGKNFGKHKLAPSISPGKTWEGWAGGAALTLATGWAAGYFLPDIPLSHRLVAAGVVAVFGPLGDLAESMLKRSAGVKDSGTFLPGHGGLLDRFDAFLLVLPVLALLQVLLG